MASSSERRPIESRIGTAWLAAFAVAVAAAVFAIDLSLPLGVAGAVPYVAVVLLGWRLPRQRHIVALATLSSALTLAGYALSPEGGVPWVVLMNRCLALGAIWITAALLIAAKRSEAARRQSDKRFRAIIENSPNLIYVKDREGRYLWFNRIFQEQIGEHFEENIGRTVAECVDERFASVYSDHDAAVLESRDTVVREELVPYPDGSAHTHIATKFPLFDADGEVSAIVGINTDITARKEAEEEVRRLNRDLERRVEARTAELRESEERFRIIAESANVALYITREADGGFLYANKAGAELVGVSQENLLGRSSPEFFDEPDYRPALLKELNETPRVRNNELRIKRADGSLRWCLDSVTKMKFRGENVLLSVVHDVTELKRAVDALRDSETRLQLITDALPALISYVNRDERWVFANRTYERWFGRSPQDLIGLHVAEGLGQEAYKMIRPHIRRVLAGDPVTYEASLPYASGGTRDIEAVYVPHFADDGEVAGYFAMVSDITERKRTERELREAREDLARKEKLAVLGQLTATVSHEIRNPLAVLGASMHIIAENLDDPSPILSRAIERAVRNIARCDRIIDDLLDFTRVRTLQPQATDLDSWLEELLREQPVPETITLRREMGAPGVVVDLDRDRFRRAVINIFENACQAMTEGAGGDQMLTFRTRRTDSRVEVAVRDTGPGIPSDVLARIYEPLFSTKGFGTGLGLTVVKQIMEQHAGGVEIDSEPGRGTEVALWLPLSNLGEDDGRHA